MLSEEDAWSAELQHLLEETIRGFFQLSWSPDSDDWYWSGKGFVAYVLDVADMLQGIEILRVDRTTPLTKRYATVIGPIAKSVRDVHNLVHHILSRVDEDFFVLIPLHEEESLRFWYLTGTKTHGHEGMVIIKRSGIPQIEP